MLDFRALERVHAGELLVVIFVGVFLNTLLVHCDGLPEQLETLVGVTLVFTLVEIYSRVSLQLLLDPDEVLLRV